MRIIKLLHKIGYAVAGIVTLVLPVTSVAYAVDYGAYGAGSSTSMAAYSSRYNGDGGAAYAPSTTQATTTVPSSGGATAPASTTPKTTQATITPTGTTSSQGIYAAMGDSVAAGLGLAPFTHPSGDDTRCGRSSEAYPVVIANKKQLRYVNATCSGATVGDIVTKQGVDGPNITKQLDTAFSAGKPQLITITAGANDVRYVDFLRSCYTTNCATKTGDLAASGLLAAMQLKLAYALQAISDRGGGSPPQVIMTGYYNPISNQCKGKIPNITDAEINFLNDQRYKLNKTIRDTVANYSFATYVSTDFTGHALCADEPWIQGVNDAAPIHPTARGQQHIAESVMSAIK